ncbi:MAG: TlpA family protein disulfide reductase, partial [gamma proteobacterium symbiont of Lucinoma myriamae]|nr:TlpA family protein disulfide reductase [gamma proteobacterium symbiont of Lucinoma myriamae]
HSYALPPGMKHVEKPWKAPEIDLIDINGHRHTIDDYQGKILIVNFWGTWCKPCRKEMPSLQRAYNQLIDDDILIIAIAMGDSLSEVNEFRNNNPVDFALLADKDSEVSTNWSVSALPTTYIVNPKGEVIIRIIGEYEWDSLQFLEEIKSLMN